MTKPIGGFFEMACGTSSQYHDGAIALNSARNALRYVIRAYNIREMYPDIYVAATSRINNQDFNHFKSKYQKYKKITNTLICIVCGLIILWGVLCCTRI